MADATFLAAKDTVYEQVFILGAILKPSNNCRQFLWPFLICFMKNKEAQTYDAMIKGFQKMTGNILNIQVIIFD